MNVWLLGMLTLWASVAMAESGLVLGPSTPRPDPPGPSRLVLNPPGQRPSTSSGTSGLIIGPPPAPPPPIIPWSPVLPELPVLPLPPFKPPVPPPLTPHGGPCRCLKWDYAPNPLLTFFRISVSRTSGTYTAENVRAIIPARQTIQTELACDQLFLTANGRYYTVNQAVGYDPQQREVLTSDPSDELCLVVENRQVFACEGTAMVEEPCENSGSPGALSALP